MRKEVGTNLFSPMPTASPQAGSQLSGEEPCHSSGSGRKGQGHQLEKSFQILRYRRTFEYKTSQSTSDTLRHYYI